LSSVRLSRYALQRDVGVERYIGVLLGQHMQITASDTFAIALSFTANG